MNLSDLHKDISLEIESLDRIITAVERLSERTISGEFTDDDLFIAAAIILNLYNGIENILKRICKTHNIPLPKTDDWHITLMTWFVEQALRTFPVLPILIRRGDTISMTALRKFRHIVIHGYNFTLNPSRVQTAMQEIPALYQRFRTEVLEFLRSLS
jgi:hypothetical protein